MSHGGPVLTNVVVGRNDDHGGNYLERLQTTLNFLGETLRGLRRLGDVELVYVDWGSDDPIANNLQLSDAAASTVRFIEVPPALVRQQWESDGFFSTLAVNVGVRRAEGEFIMLTDSDCMIPRSSMETLLTFLSGAKEFDLPRRDIIYPIRRFQVPASIFARRPSISAWTTLLEKLLPGARSESPSTGCLGGFSAGQLMHRDLWNEVRGYNEQLTKPWGWSDNDLMIRVTSTRDWADLVRLGVVAFHIEHGEPRKLWHVDTPFSRDPGRVNRMRIERTRTPNDDDWGLAKISFPSRLAKPNLNSGSTSAHDSLVIRPIKHNLTDRQAIEKALCAPAIGDAVENTTTHCANSYGLVSDRPERRLIGALAAFIIDANPVNMVYWGSLRGPVLFAALVQHTALQTYLVNPWSPGDADEQSCDPQILSQLLEHARYRGFSRILMSDGTAAIDRISSSDRSFGEIELAIIGPTTWGESSLGVCTELADRLAPGGAVFAIGHEAVDAMQRMNGIPWLDLKTHQVEAATKKPGWLKSPFKQASKASNVFRAIVLEKGQLAFATRPQIAAN